MVFLVSSPFKKKNKNKIQIEILKSKRQRTCWWLIFRPEIATDRVVKRAATRSKVNLHRIQRLPGFIHNSFEKMPNRLNCHNERGMSFSLSLSVHSGTGQSGETRGKDANTCQDHVWGTASSPRVSRYSAWLSSPGRFHQCGRVADAELWPLGGWGTSEKRISCMHICFFFIVFIRFKNLISTESLSLLKSLDFSPNMLSLSLNPPLSLSQQKR